VTVDLKNPAGLEAFGRLAEGADVLVETFRPGVAERLRIGYDALRARNERLIYASCPAYPDGHRLAGRPGYDALVQASSGQMWEQPGWRLGPVFLHMPMPSMGAFYLVSTGVLTALFARERTGRGQHVDTSLFEGALALSIWETAELWATGRVPEPLGSAHRLTAPYQALRTRDGHITVGGNNERLWARLCTALGRGDLLEDPRFAGNERRMEHRGELVAELESRLAERDTGDWVEALLEAGVPCGPIHDYAQVVADPHTLAREMVVELEHPVEGTVRALGMPVKLSDTPGENRRPAPLLGEHTEEVLREAGLEADEIAALAVAPDDARGARPA
jgi:formyl-CoA transferase